MKVKYLTSVLVFLSFSFIGLSQCADIKTSSDTAYCYSETAINLSQRLIVSNNDMTLSSNISGLITKNNNIWWLNSKLLKGQSNDSLGITLYKEYYNSTNSCLEKDSLIVQIHFVDLRANAPKTFCSNYGRINLTNEFALADYNFSSNTPGLVVKEGSTWWFNTPMLDNKAQTIRIYKTDTSKLGCIAKDSFHLSIKPNPIVLLQDRVLNQLHCDFELSNPKLNIVLFPNAANINGGFRTWTILNKDGGLAPAGALRNEGTAFQAKWVLASNFPDTTYQGKYELEFSFQNTLTGCIGYDTAIVEVKKAPNLTLGPIPDQCKNSDTLDLMTYTNYKNGEWKVIEENAIRPNPSNKYDDYIINGKLFDPSIVTGDYNIYYLRYEQDHDGCLIKDSVTFIVNGFPKIEPPVLDTVCNTLSSVSLEARIDGVSNQPGAIWSGTHVTGSQFTPTNVESDTAQDFSGPYPIKIHYTDPITGCSDTVYTGITVQAQPTIEITSLNDSFGLIYGKPVLLNAESSHDNGILWTSSGDGIISNSSSLNTEYTQGTSDKSNLSLTIYAETLAYGTACPVAKDSVEMSIYALGLKDNSLLPLKVYPTPTSSNLSIVLPQSAQNGTIKVMDTNGKVVQSINIEHYSNLYTMDLSIIPNGIYFIKLNTSEGDYIEKIMKVGN